MVEYLVRDGLSLYGTFGQDFETGTGETPLVSLFGLTFGFGGTPFVQPVTTTP